MASLIAHTTVAGAGASGGINTTAATLLVVIANYDRSETAPTIVEAGVGGNNTWTPLTAQLEAGFPAQRMYYAENPAHVGAGHTFQLSMPGGSGTQSGEIQAWDGTLTSGVLDAQNGATATGVESIQTGAVSPAADGALVIAGWASGSARSPSIGSGFTAGDSVSAGGVYQGASAYLVQGTAASVNPTWDWTGQGNARAAVTIAAFKTAPAGLQYARPSSDIAANGWLPSSGSDLYAMLDESVADDGDYIYSPPNPTTEQFEVKLSALAGPLTGLSIKVRLQAVGLDTVFDLNLVEAATIRDSWSESVSVAAGVVERPRTFSSGVYTAISDPTNLRIRGIARA